MQLANLFSTPVALHEQADLAALNKEITDILVRESETLPSLTRSNLGGWHSGYDLQNRPEACFQKLNQLIIAAAQQTGEAIAKQSGRKLVPVTATTQKWAMVMRHGDSSKPHCHSDASWASVYYPDVGDDVEKAHPGSGAITFVDPRSGFLYIPGLEMAVGEFVVNPKAGQLLVFPGWLMHYVNPYKGQRPRVSIACNVMYQIIRQ